MNAQQLIKSYIFQRGLEIYDRFLPVMVEKLSLDNSATIEDVLKAITAENIDSLYNEFEWEDAIQDGRNETRSCGTKTNLKPDVFSRNYEVDNVAMLINGQWVSWDYIYGGGKHSDPDNDYDWIQYAKLVNCTEEQVTVTKYTFSEVEA
ncbi:hypothetical protein ACI8B_210151 [Acinetobacter proteolyticus]|uniref:Uncharacterized protein n=1 Tax=Acinetobacter proteolyticus TaxID=1776741 RepID=A0A653K492_9GAMM|nr:hypothetical protein [Acinetobacter proteolyticus]VXA55360.1 hypothetical protein ACI8B_210151 [Acinetobacter proteolyticus]